MSMGGRAVSGAWLGEIQAAARRDSMSDPPSATGADDHEGKARCKLTDRFPRGEPTSQRRRAMGETRRPAVEPLSQNLREIYCAEITGV